MAVDRLVGVDHLSPRLPQGVITASQGTAATDLAAGTTLAAAKAYTDAAVADISGGGGGGGTTVEVFTYTDEADARPAVDVVFWIPNPYTLGDPFGAVEGDCVLRSTPDTVQGLNGLRKIWKGTPLEYDAITTPADDTFYAVI